MGISDIFAAFRAGSQPQPQQPVATPTINAAPGSPVTNPNPVATPDNKPLTQAEKPMGEWENLWEPPKPVEGAPAETPSVFSVTQKQIMEAAGKADFKKALPNELITKILSGGEEAPVALADAFNMIAQQAYGQSSFAATKITERALREAQAKLEARIPEMIREHTVKDSLRTESPLFSNPAVTPMLEMIQGQMAVKFPNATASELRNMSKNYLQDFAKTFAPKEAPSKSASTEVDWTKFLGDS